jgi:hypothetical protein
MAFWTERFGCGADSALTDGAIRMDPYPDCAGGRRAVLYTLDGGGHDWPRRDRALSQGPEAAEVLWRFFSGEDDLAADSPHRRGLTGNAVASCRRHMTALASAGDRTANGRTGWVRSATWYRRRREGVYRRLSRRHGSLVARAAGSGLYTELSIGVHRALIDDLAADLKRLNRV